MINIFGGHVRLETTRPRVVHSAKDSKSDAIALFRRFLVTPLTVDYTRLGVSGMLRSERRLPLPLRTTKTDGSLN